MQYIITVLCLCVFTARALPAGEHCAACGCQCECQKVCRVVCELKEVKTVCYDCRCEDYCIPGPSCKIGKQCQCDPCNPGTGCEFFDCLLGQRDCETCRNVWQPSCEASVRSKNVLIKREVTKKVPTYKWIVERRCPGCCQQTATTKEAALAALPAEERAQITDVAAVPPAAIKQVDHTAPITPPARTPWERLFK